MQHIELADDERAALQQFKRRIAEITTEVQAIDSELARRDILVLAHRTRDAIRSTRDLLDRNVDILFAGQPAQIHHDLYAEIEHAEGHVSRALSDELEFQGMERRLYLAARLAEDVLTHIYKAVEAIERRHGSGISVIVPDETEPLTGSV